MAYPRVVPYCPGQYRPGGDGVCPGLYRYGTVRVEPRAASGARGAAVVSVEGIYVGDIAILPEEGHRTGIYKHPVHGPVRLDARGVEGDHQADRANHGGPDRALNHYPAEHYARWREIYPSHAGKFVRSSFGENLSATGLTETSVCIGDVFRVGTAVVQVAQPRNPCWKLAHRFEIPDLARRAADAGLTGWLYRVLEPGAVATGDAVRPLRRDPAGIAVARVWEAVHARRPDADELRRLAGLETLALAWRRRFAARLAFLQRSRGGPA